MAEAQTAVIRRKLAAVRSEADTGGPGADRAWRLALARTAQDLIKLPLDVISLTLERHSLAELLELPPERALIVVLEGPQQTMGLWVAAPAVLAALIEMQTLGRVSANPASSRKPTRTDAAMVADLVDAALKGLEHGLAGDPDLIWAGGFRYASFLDDPRPLGLLLEDEPYRVLRAEVSRAGGANQARSCWRSLPRGAASCRCRRLMPPPGSTQARFLPPNWPTGFRGPIASWKPYLRG